MGGLSADQGLLLMANSHMSEAKNLRREAARMKSMGKSGEAGILNSKANNLEQAAKRLLKEYERQKRK